MLRPSCRSQRGQSDRHAAQTFLADVVWNAGHGHPIAVHQTLPRRPLDAPRKSVTLEVSRVAPFRSFQTVGHLPVPCVKLDQKSSELIQLTWPQSGRLTNHRHRRPFSSVIVRPIFAFFLPEKKRSFVVLDEKGNFVDVNRIDSFTPCDGWPTR